MFPYEKFLGTFFHKLWREEEASRYNFEFLIKEKEDCRRLHFQNRHDDKSFDHLR